MKREFIVREFFKLADGSIILACEGPMGRVGMGVAQLVSQDGDTREKIELIGERSMLNRTTSSPEMHAVEIKDNLDLTPEEIRSGKWRLICDN